jgi:hypothetical protein
VQGSKQIPHSSSLSKSKLASLPSPSSLFLQKLSARRFFSLVRSKSSKLTVKDQICIQVCGKSLDIWGVDMSKNNPASVVKIDRGEPIDCTPISFEDEHHSWLLGLQQP